MQDVQSIFVRMQELKKEQKELAEAYKDTLKNTDRHEEVTEEFKKIKETKKQIEVKVQAQMGKSYQRLEEVKLELIAQKELLTDVAITSLMGGSTVKVTDEYNNTYEPVYAVTFKKIY